MTPTQYMKTQDAIRIFNNMGMAVKTTSKHWEIKERSGLMLGVFESSNELYTAAVAYQQGYFAGLIGEIERLEDSIGDM